MSNNKKIRNFYIISIFLIVIVLALQLSIYFCRKKYQDNISQFKTKLYNLNSHIVFVEILSDEGVWNLKLKILLLFDDSTYMVVNNIKNPFNSDVDIIGINGYSINIFDNTSVRNPVILSTRKICYYAGLEGESIKDILTHHKELADFYNTVPVISNTDDCGLKIDNYIFSKQVLSKMDFM